MDRGIAPRQSAWRVAAAIARATSLGHTVAPGHAARAAPALSRAHRWGRGSSVAHRSRLPPAKRPSYPRGHDLCPRRRAALLSRHPRRSGRRRPARAGLRLELSGRGRCRGSTFRAGSTRRSGAASWRKGAGRERIYIVEPTGEFDDDPNLTDKKFPGNPTQSYRSREPLRIVGEVAEWEGHSPERLKEMKDFLARLAAEGDMRIID